MSTEMRAQLVLLFLVILILPAVAQQNGCPIQIQKIELFPPTSRPLTAPTGRQFSSNREMILRIRYRNVASKPVNSGYATAETLLLAENPTHDAIQAGSQPILLEPLRTGQKKTTSLKVFSSGIPPRVRITQVSFADGSSWSPSDASSCVFAAKHRPVHVSLPIPAD